MDFIAEHTEHDVLTDRPNWVAAPSFVQTQTTSIVWITQNHQF